MRKQLEALKPMAGQDATSGQKQESQDSDQYGKVIMKNKGGEIKDAYQGNTPGVSNAMTLSPSNAMADGGRVRMDVGGKVPVPSSPDSGAQDKQQYAQNLGKAEKTGTSDSETSKAAGYISNPSSLVDTIKNAWAKGGKIETCKSCGGPVGRKQYASPQGPVDQDDSAPQALTGQGDIGGVQDITPHLPPPSEEDKLKSKLQDRYQQAKDALDTAHGVLFGGAPKSDVQQALETDQPPTNAQSQQQAPGLNQEDQAAGQESDDAVQLGAKLAGIQAPEGMSQEDVDNSPAVDGGQQVSHEDEPLNPDGTFGKQGKQGQQAQPQQMPPAQAAIQPTYDDHKQAVNQELHQENAAFNQDLANGHITPKTYHDLMGKDVLSRIGTAFGLLISGAGAGLTHQPNAVLQMMNNEIDRDIDAQKTSKTNAQTLLKLTQEGMIAKSQSGQMDAETALKSNALTKMHALSFAAHEMATKASQYPVGSKQYNDAQTALAMANQAIQNEQVGLADRVASQTAYMKMVLGPQGQGPGGGQGQSPDDPATQIRRKQLMNMITPEQSQAALSEQKMVENKMQINQNALDSFDTVAKLASIPSYLKNPIQNKERIDAEWAPMMDKLTKDTEGRVTPITVEMMSSLKPRVKDDTATLNLKRSKLNAILNAGFSTPVSDSIGIVMHKGNKPEAQQQLNQAQNQNAANALRWAQANLSNPTNAAKANAIMANPQVQQLLRQSGR
jgi:hypothetical protein